MSDLFAYVDEKTVQKVRAELYDSPNPIDKVIADSLALVDVWSGRTKTTPLTTESNSSPSQQLGLILLRAGITPKSEARGGHLAFNMTTRWAHEFISRFLDELRDIICSPKKDRKKLGAKAHGIVTALVVYLMGKFHLESATAMGIAVYVLMILGSALKKSFCDSSDAEVLATLANT